MHCRPIWPRITSITFRRTLLHLNNCLYLLSRWLPGKRRDLGYFQSVQTSFNFQCERYWTLMPMQLCRLQICRQLRHFYVRQTCFTIGQLLRKSVHLLYLIHCFYLAYNIDTTAKQVAKVWARVAKRKKTLIGWRNVWNMRWRAPDQEVDQRGHEERLCKKDCQAHNLNREDAMDHGRWKKLIKIGWSGWWVGECFFWYRLTRVVPDKGPVVVVVLSCLKPPFNPKKNLANLWQVAANLFANLKKSPDLYANLSKTWF